MSNVAYYDQLAESYDLFFRDLERNMDAEGDWLADVLGRYGVRTVLDASCGTGRQAIPLLERGFRVVGADPSAPMLRVADRTANAHGVNLPLVRSTFEGLATQFGPDFDAVIALGNGLCNLESPEVIVRSLQSMRSCCRPGGLCLVGIKDFDLIRARRSRFHGRKIIDRGGSRTILFEIWDFEDPILTATAFILKGQADPDLPGLMCWETRTAQTREYMVGCAEMTRLAQRAGFAGFRRLDHPSEAVYLMETISNSGFPSADPVTADASL